MTHRDNLDALGFAFGPYSFAFFDGVEDAKFFEPEFPRSDAVGSKRLFPLCLDFCINLQMRNDPSHDKTLIVSFEVCNVALCAFRYRNLILHLGIVPKKSGALNVHQSGPVCPTALPLSR